MALLTTDTEPDKALKPDNTADVLLGLGVRRLLDCLQQRGFHLRIDGNELEVLYPPGAMSASLRNVLTQRRDELIELGTGVPVAISDVRLGREWKPRMLTIVRQTSSDLTALGSPETIIPTQ